MLDHCLLLHQETTLYTIPITNLNLCSLIKLLHKHVLKDPDVICIKNSQIHHVCFRWLQETDGLFSGMSTEQLLLRELVYSQMVYQTLNQRLSVFQCSTCLECPKLFLFIILAAMLSYNVNLNFV